jgi:hypothetical protein
VHCRHFRKRNTICFRSCQNNRRLQWMFGSWSSVTRQSLASVTCTHVLPLKQHYVISVVCKFFPVSECTVPNIKRPNVRITQCYSNTVMPGKCVCVCVNVLTCLPSGQNDSSVYSLLTNLSAHSQKCACSNLSALTVYEQVSVWLVVFNATHNGFSRFLQCFISAQLKHWEIMWGLEYYRRARHLVRYM